MVQNRSWLSGAIFLILWGAKNLEDFSFTTNSNTKKRHSDAKMLCVYRSLKSGA
jgi:hypothetical protein